MRLSAPCSFICQNRVGHNNRFSAALLLSFSSKSAGGASELPLRSISAASLEAFVRANVKPGATLLTDGHSSYPGLTDYRHDPRVVGKMAGHAVLPWIHRVFSLMKRWGLGTYHGLRRKHVDTYLDELLFSAGPIPAPRSEPIWRCERGCRGVANDDQEDDGGAAQAFAELRAEVTVMRRAMENLPAAIRSLAPPDYSPSFGAVGKTLANVETRLAGIEGHPALKMTPAQHGSAMQQAGASFIDRPPRGATRCRRAAAPGGQGMRPRKTAGAPAARFHATDRHPIGRA